MKHVMLGVLGISLAAAAMIASCSSEHDGSVTRPADPTDVIDRELMIALGQAKNFHRKAKIYMTDGNLPAATAAVRQVLSLQFPRGAPEAEDVRNDGRALLAKLLVSQGQIDEATRTVDEGLAQSQRESFFVANLYTVQGEIHEARAAAFMAAGDSGKASADEARRAAIASYDKSIKINERLQKKLLEDR
jgi:tetratricopeptide (TPR) repeat protein